jgi:hypothetical protein
MTLSTDDGESACCLNFIRQLDVGSSTGHIGCYGHGSRLTGMFYNLRLARMLLGVEHLMLDSAQT